MKAVERAFVEGDCDPVNSSTTDEAELLEAADSFHNPKLESMKQSPTTTGLSSSHRLKEIERRRTDKV